MLCQTHILQALSYLLSANTHTIIFWQSSKKRFLLSLSKFNLSHPYVMCHKFCLAFRPNVKICTENNIPHPYSKYWHLVTHVISPVWWLWSVLWLLAAGGNMLSIIPDTPRGESRGENGRNISPVLLQLYFMIYNETHNAGSTQPMIYRLSQEWEENLQFTAAEMIVIVKEGARAKCNNVNDKRPRELWPRPEPRAIKYPYRYGPVCPLRWEIHIEAPNPFSIRHQIKELKC